jgi:hypothetical protein
MMSRPARCVVEHILCLSVTIRIEHLPDMGQAVPLGGVLQGQDDLVVAHDIGGRRVASASGPGATRFLAFPRGVRRTIRDALISATCPGFASLTVRLVGAERSGDGSVEEWHLLVDVVADRRIE